MNEPEKPKRRWFQFHLSTMVLLSVTAGGVLWANIVDRNRRVVPTSVIHEYEGGPEIPIEYGEFSERGWPMSYRFDYAGMFQAQKTPSLLFDFVIAIGMLTAVAIASEWWIRRKNRGGG
jgi:hypothetical protein